MKCVYSLKVFTFNKYLKKLEISRGDISLEMNRRDPFYLTICKYFVNGLSLKNIIFSVTV